MSLPSVEGSSGELYQYSINMKYKQPVFTGGGGERVADINRAVRFCVPFGHQGNRARPRNPLKRAALGKREKSWLYLLKPSLYSSTPAAPCCCRGVNAKEIGSTCLSLRASVAVNSVLISDEGVARLYCPDVLVGSVS